MKHVPEGTVPSREEQLSSLRDKLLGNQAFGACRGRIHQLFEEVVDQADSPSQFCSHWDDTSGKMRVMGNLLSQFKRDGWNHAYDELFCALKNPQHIIVGETVPLEETTPMTLVVLEPTKTFLLIRWLLESHWIYLNKHLEWIDAGKKGPYPDELTNQLFTQFTTLEDRSRARRTESKYEGEDLRKAHNDTVGTDLRGVLDRTAATKRLKLGWNQWNDHIEIGDQDFAHLLPGTQKETLSLFSREEQERIGTWQFNLPKALASQKPFNVGFHCEAEHERWHAEYPALTSLGVSHGWGSIIHPMDPMTTIKKIEGYQLVHSGNGVREGDNLRFFLD